MNIKLGVTNATVAQIKVAEKLAAKKGITFAQALRLVVKAQKETTR